MRSLLDVNVLIALLDSDHLHHLRAMGWLKENITAGWASCPLTQNGCIRIMSQAAYPNALPPAAVATRLAESTTTLHHAFWPDSVSLLDAKRIAWREVTGSRQVTDVSTTGLDGKQCVELHGLGGFAYLVDFLALPPDHKEDDLQRGLLTKLKLFLTELGRDFCFVGEHVPCR